MDAVSQWDDEDEPYMEQTDREERMARHDLYELCRRAKKLLPRARDYTQGQRYLETLWMAKDAMDRGRYDSACGYFYNMLHFYSTSGVVERRILVNIIGTIEEYCHVI